MIAVENLAVRAGLFSLSDISFSIPTGQCGSLMGKTGTGKTTLLEAICGLKPTLHGRIRLLDKDVTHLKPALRGIGYVPQDGALFPSMSVREHLAFALTIRHWEAEAIERRVQELAALLGLEQLLERGVGKLSGGEAQRTALGRALSNHPKVLCLDEPLSALDEETRAEMCEVLKNVRALTGVTMLYVTHSLEEARKLADQIFVLRDGKIHPGITRKSNLA